MTPSVDAHRNLPGVMRVCSWRAGWRSLLLRGYDEPGVVEEFTTAPTDDQLIVLVTAGRYPIEVRHRGRWQTAQYDVGSIGMTAPGEAATLRWRNGVPATTLHLHLPGQTVRAAAEALWNRDLQKVAFPNALKYDDPTIVQVMLALQEAALGGVPDSYAEGASDFLAVHLLTRHTGFVLPRVGGGEGRRLRRLDDFMRAHLSRSITLTDLAREAGFSRFHLVRVFKKAYGETPFRRLSRLRIEHARRLLHRGDETVTQIALRCGYDNPSHFATAFRRMVGVSPSAYRRQGE